MPAPINQNMLFILDGALLGVPAKLYFHSEYICFPLISKINLSVIQTLEIYSAPSITFLPGRRITSSSKSAVMKQVSSGIHSTNNHLTVNRTCTLPVCPAKNPAAIHIPSFPSLDSGLFPTKNRGKIP